MGERLTPGMSLAPAPAVAQASILRLVCGLGLTNAVLMVIVTVAVRPTLFAISAAAAWVATWALLIRHAQWVQSWLARAPGALYAMALLGMVPVAFDAGLDGTLTTQAVWLTWVAAVTVSASRTLLAAVSMSLATAAVLAWSGMSTYELFRGPDRFQVTLLICTPVVTALVGLAVVGVFRDLLQNATAILDDVAAGGPASTPALGRLLHRGPQSLLTAGPPSPPATKPELTRTEADIVAMLRDGHTPKQIALQRGRSIHTVRTQIKHAKRKVGARTLNELISRTWPTS